METDLTLITRPTAVQCVSDLVLVSLSHWQLERIAPVVDTLARDLMQSVVQTIGSTDTSVAVWQLEHLPPLVRCLLWSQPGFVGFGIEELSDVEIPTPAAAQLFPEAHWGVTPEHRGKTTWFAVPLRQEIPPTPAPSQPSPAEITSPIRLGQYITGQEYRYAP